MALTSKLRIAVTADETSALDLVTASVPLSVVKDIALASGTGANQADKVFSDRRTLAASATEDLDLAGVLLDAFGAAVTFARIKGLVVVAAAANTHDVVLGAAAATPWTALLGATGTAVIKPGGFLAVGAGGATAYPVTGGSDDLLKVANSGAGSGVTYDIVLIGASA